MLNVNGIPGAVPPPAVDPVSAVPAGEIRPAGAAGISDVVEISTIAKLAARIQEIPDVRTELVERVKVEVAAGTYETPERLDLAVDRLMDDMFPRF
jgi:negative regulator of flagellin synthesis FlgM